MSWESIDEQILLAVRMLVGENYLLMDPHDTRFIENVGTIRFGRPGRYLMPLTKEYIKHHLVRIRHKYKESTFLEMYSDKQELCVRS